MSKITKKDLNERLLMVETLLGLHRALPEQISNNQANNAIFRMQCALSSGKEIAGRNPTEVEQRIEALEEFATYADNMLTELNHALPDPEYDAKCEAAVAGVEASLDSHRERLGLNKPQLKKLDQSVFNGLDEKWRWVARDHNGDRYAYAAKPYARDATGTWVNNSDLNARYLDAGYDDENWQNSLIERDIAKELTGSDLCREMLARGDTRIMCKVFDIDRQHDVTHVIRAYSEGKFHTRANRWTYAIPINNQGEPLTAAEAGL